MPDSVNLILRTPPTLNHLYVDMVLPPKPPVYMKHRAFRVLSKEAKAYKEHVAEVAGGGTPFIGKVWVTVKWYRPRQIGDIDAPIKIILDAMSGHVYLDDKQVKRLHVDCLDDKDRPRVEVTIEALGLC